MQATFEWDTAKTKGATFSLTAVEWNRLIGWASGCLQARDIRYEAGEGPSDYPMTEAVAGEPVDNEMFNQVADAVEAAMAASVYIGVFDSTELMLRPGDVKGLLVDRKNNGDSITAEDLNLLRDGANNVYLVYAFADSGRDETNEHWLLQGNMYINPDVDKVYVVIGEWTYGEGFSYFEDQHVTLYHYDSDNGFEKIKDVYIYR
jgi:hypothetical protein